MKKNTRFWRNKMILVTGGTGSFGKKFIQILLKEYPVRRLVVYSRDELKQEEIRTNINGSENIINTAIDKNVKKVLALSTDKAVSPINLYGATKLVAEKLFVQGNNYSSSDGTKFSCVRYGNVVGSRGSVIPLFQHQKKNGVITITDTRMSRFWLTLEQGVRFVIRCVEQMNGGETFIPKTPSMKIIDLAKVIAPNSKIKITGIRPGEKLFETLISENDAPNTYEFNDMYIIRPVSLFREQKNKLLLKGKKMKLERYDSATNGEWLTQKQLRKMIA